MASIDGAIRIHGFAAGDGGWIEIYRHADRRISIALVREGVIKELSDPIATTLDMPTICGLLRGQTSLMVSEKVQPLAAIALLAGLALERGEIEL